jgi:hypothetical protein
LSKQQKWWESDNSAFVKKYRTVAGFFGPTSGDRDYAAYLRAIDNGQIKTLTPEEWLGNANHRVAASIYAQKRLQVGDSPDEAQRDWLRQINEALKEKYPGYDPEGTHGKLTSPDRAMHDLELAAQDPAVEKEPLAKATRIYFKKRQEALDSLAASGLHSLDSKAAEPVRAWLREIGSAIIAREPKFQQMWDYLLYNEVRVEDNG